MGGSRMKGQIDRVTLDQVFSGSGTLPSAWDFLEFHEDADFMGGEVLEPVDFLRDDEKLISGTSMLERAKGFGMRAGKRHAAQLLAQIRGIPEEWSEFIHIFPGTVGINWGELAVPMLMKKDGIWKPGYGYVSQPHFYTAHYRIIRVSSMGREE